MKLEDFRKFIDDRCTNATPLFLTMRGSHAYGTNVETSDHDYAGVYIQDIDDILGNSYKEQINDDKNDTVLYELKRFIELLASANPTMIELLNTPDDCIIYKHPAFDAILANKDKFITKKCKQSFGGYARQQITKAKGQNKKVNWEKEKIERRTTLDFCYYMDNGKSIPITTYLSKLNLDQRFCGLVSVAHARDLYAIYYDFDSAAIHSDLISKWARNVNKFYFKIWNHKVGLGYKGIAFEDSNQLRLSSIPKNNTHFIGYLSYNKDGYSQHCDDYKSYQTWLENKNEARWIDNKSHGQKIDGKNMLHCQRLLNMAKEIAEGKGVIVRRPDAKYLISIRKGEVDLQTLIDGAEKQIKDIDALYDSVDNTLPDDVSFEFVNDLILQVRKQAYKNNTTYA